MKTKRLRTLLVAGFLSLVPAVTLTSCGGGGGGGGGNGDGGGVEDVLAPAELRGKTAVIRLGNGEQRITFNGDMTVSAVWTNNNTGETQIIGGAFGSTTLPDGTAYVSVTFNNGEEWSIWYASENGRLEGIRAVRKFRDDEMELSYVRFE